LHRTDLIVFPLTLQTITTARMMSIWGKGGACRPTNSVKALKVTKNVQQLLTKALFQNKQRMRIKRQRANLGSLEMAVKMKWGMHLVKISQKHWQMYRDLQKSWSESEKITADFLKIAKFTAPIHIHCPHVVRMRDSRFSHNILAAFFA